ncbi:Os06g0676000, partial [Oryza sativa Japonica Group]
ASFCSSSTPKIHKQQDKNGAAHKFKSHFCDNMGNWFVYRCHQHLLPDNKLCQAASPQRSIDCIPSILRDIRFPGDAHIHGCNSLPRFPEEQESYPAIAGGRFDGPHSRSRHGH